MGIDVHGTRFLLHAQALGADLSRTATIGRQGLFLTPAEFRTLARAFGRTFGPEDIDSVFGRSQGHAEGLMHYLGAAEIESFDFSPYEGATRIHDMNQPIPAAFRERFTAVIDGGSLEHVFNFPQAIRNCMEMVEPGGHYLGITPANNFLGHGFYQFSPELYFNVFNAENGFEVVSMVAFEDRKNAQWYAVKSPMEVSGRVTLCNNEPVFLLVLAKRVAVKPIFATTPQQSDYAAIWRERAESAAAAQPEELTPRPLPVRIAKSVLPASLRLGLRRLFSRPLTDAPKGFDPRFYRPIDPAADRGRP